jgi:hypothetical protein
MPDDSKHANDDVLEAYVLGKLKDPELTELEEHLLICEQCQDALTDADAYVQTMQSAMKQLEAETQTAVPKRAPRILSPKWLSFAAVGVAAALAVFFVPVRSTETQTVNLSVARSTTPETGRARAGTPLKLNIDTTQLSPSPAYKVQVVDQNGSELWSGSIQAVANHIAVVVPKISSAGKYWVRVYAPNGEAPLREYGLELK